MRLRTWTSAVACFTAALVLFTADLSTAAGRTPSPASTWGGASCASASLDGFEMYDDELIVLGTATRCGHDDTPATFAVAFFRADATTGGAYGTGVRWYAANGQLRPFGVLGPRTPTTWGACVMLDPTVRLACGALTPTASRPGWTYSPLPLDDPLVTKPVHELILPSPGPGNPTQPNCGGCF